jgi:hypothetical protein
MRYTLRLVAAATALVSAVAAVAAAPAVTAPEMIAPVLDVSEPCLELPDPSRWEDVGTPDVGAARAIIAVHRGAANLAPENTMDAYRYAIAYGVEMIEIDVQQTLDHRFVSFHDTQLESKTDGEGYIQTKTYDELRLLNVAANDSWRGSEYDPSQMPSLEEIFELAAATGTGIMFDLKESVTDAASVALMAQTYGLIEGSVFIPFVPVRAEMIKAVVPDAVLNFSNQMGNLPGNAPRGALYALTPEYGSFGSSVTAFDAGDIAEVHDGCAIVLPNVYQGAVTGSEAGDLRYARSIGADGAQVNNPDVATEVLGRPVSTMISRTLEAACLVDAAHGLGLPGKTVLVDSVEVSTARGGCVPAAANASVTWSGDGSALSAG